MAADDKPFDPNDVLRGFNPRAGQKSAEPLDVSSLLDGWRPQAEPEVQEPARPGERAARSSRAMDLDDVTDVAHIDISERRVSDEDLVLQATHWDAPQDDEPIILELPEVVVAPAPQADELEAVLSSAQHQAAEDAVVREIEPDWEPDTAIALRHASNPRVLERWQPGVWVGAVARAFGAATEIHQHADGPVVDSHAPHLLLALWLPQGLNEPLLSRWPHRVLLCAADDDNQVLEDMLRLMPREAVLWLTDTDLDWALLGELALHHLADLRAFQETGLRGFIERERMLSFSRMNDGYWQPTQGGAVQPRLDGSAGGGKA